MSASIGHLGITSSAAAGNTFSPWLPSISFRILLEHHPLRRSMAPTLTANSRPHLFHQARGEDTADDDDELLGTERSSGEKGGTILEREARCEEEESHLDRWRKRERKRDRRERGRLHLHLLPDRSSWNHRHSCFLFLVEFSLLSLPTVSRFGRAAATKGLQALASNLFGKSN